MLGQAQECSFIPCYKDLKAVHGRRYLEGTKIHLWPSSLTLYLQTATEQGCPRPQWSQLFSSVKKRKKKCGEEGQYGWSSFPQYTVRFFALLSGCQSPTPQQKSKAPPRGPATAGEGMRTCMMLGCLGRSSRSSPFSPRTTVWDCLQTKAGAAALAALQKLWGSWKGVGGGNPAAIPHLSYHVHKATELDPRVFETGSWILNGKIWGFIYLFITN